MVDRDLLGREGRGRLLCTPRVQVTGWNNEEECPNFRQP